MYNVQAGYKYLYIRVKDIEERQRNGTRYRRKSRREGTKARRESTDKNEEKDEGLGLPTNVPIFFSCVTMINTAFA